MENTTGISSYSSIARTISVDFDQPRDMDEVDHGISSPLTSTMIDNNMDEDDAGRIPAPSNPAGIEDGNSEDSNSMLLRKLGSLKSLCIQRKKVSREAFFAQAILIYIISIACIVNLSINSGPSNVWVALLSGCLGYLLPEPKIRREKTKSLLDIPKES